MGLHRLAPATSELETVKATVASYWFEARGELLTSGKRMIVATSNGTSFVGQPIDVYEEMADDNPPTWKP